MIDLFVGYKKKENSFDTLRDALLSIDATVASTDEDSITRSFTSKEYPAPVSCVEPVTIHMAAGEYREKIVITRPNITLEGEGDGTCIIFGDGAFFDMPDGEKRGTFRTATMRIDTHDFTARNIKFQNDAGIGAIAGQALALYVDGDRNLFEDCIFVGSQDTLFTAPLPLKEAKPGGFKGPGETHDRVMGRQCYRRCHITGDVDFIFGSAIALFEDCTIFSKKACDKPVPESPDEDVIYGYVTAASTPQEYRFGYVFKDCKLISDCPKGSVYLGRPWREYAKTVFIHCELGEHIHPAGWQDWNKPHDHFFYAEYDCYGPGADISGRADFSHQLTEEQAKEYTPQAILGDWAVL